MPGQVGNSGGKKGRSGRKPREIEKNLTALLNECVDAQQREAIIRKLAEDSQHVSFGIRHEARKLLLSYLYGKPINRLEVGGEGGRPIPITIIEPVKPDA